MLSLTLISTILLALAAFCAVVLLLRRPGLPLQSKLLRLLLNLLLAAGLWWILQLPVAAPAESETLVLTPGFSATDWPAEPPAQAVVLPGVTGAPLTARAVPDLATALRQLPAQSTLRVLGHGLAEHDWAAATGHPLQFVPAAVPAGIIELHAPSRAVAGRMFAVRGRLNGLPGATVELLAPGGLQVAKQVVAADGGFVLRASSPVVGPLTWTLQVFEQTGETKLETAAVAVEIVAADVQRLHLYSGGPDPELKYLRRWALDQGMQLSSRISLSSGIPAQGKPFLFDAASLDALDLLVLDERSWAGLREPERSAIVAALRRGLGLLLRPRGLPDANTLKQWRELGFVVSANELPRTVQVRQTLQLPEQFPPLTRQALTVVSPDSRILLHDDADQPLALLRTLGRGRIVLWWLEDSFKLRLNGQPQVYSQLWSGAFEMLARPRAAPRPEWLDAPRQAQRSVVCGLPMAAESRMVTADGSFNALLTEPDPQHPGLGCAAWWPRESGWQALQAGDDEWLVFVRPRADLPVLQAAERSSATLALVNESTSAAAMLAQSVWQRGWWMLAWLLLAAGLWWLEREDLPRA